MVKHFEWPLSTANFAENLNHDPALRQLHSVYPLLFSMSSFRRVSHSTFLVTVSSPKERYCKHLAFSHLASLVSPTASNTRRHIGGSTSASIFTDFDLYPSWNAQHPTPPPRFVSVFKLCHYFSYRFQFRKYHSYRITADYNKKTNVHRLSTCLVSTIGRNYSKSSTRVVLERIHRICPPNILIRKPFPSS
jgi:hypothetical protein